MTPLRQCPVPELAARVGPVHGPSGIWAEVEAERLSALWPAWLPRPEPTHSLWRILFDNVRDGGWRPGKAASNRDVSSRELILQSHAWIAENNVRRLARHFSPLWGDMPASLGHVTGQSLHWIAAADCLARRGPGAFRRLYPDLAAQPGTSPGDCAALHLAIEDLIATIARKAGIRTDGRFHRKPGGLRSAAVMNVWAAVASAESSRRLRRWWHAITLLAAQSPLTQIVYLDVFSFAAPANFVCLFLPPAAADSQSKQEGSHNGWLEIWISLVARSLLGAILSPPPAQEELDEAQRQVDQAQATARDRLHRRRIIVTEQAIRQHPLVQAALNRYTEVQTRLLRQFESRIPIFAGALAANGLFHIRFIDMFVRHVASQCAGEISSDWHRLTPDQRFRDESRNRYFFGPSAICFQAFEKALFGSDGLKAPQETAALRACFKALRPPGADSTALSSTFHLREYSVRELVSRYEDQTITLPGGEPGHTSAYIWQRWTVDLESRLPADVATEVEEQ